MNLIAQKWREFIRVHMCFLGLNKTKQYYSRKYKADIFPSENLETIFNMKIIFNPLFYNVLKLNIFAMSLFVREMIK